ncbi:LysR family transcriptional regulator [Nocardioides sp. LHD-245]|uniref:LysR family transcriptional regulator n=1 Tax=Nocardioides sp. LHD-245 TaxID=3051387 RepID=UPI0027E1EC68|nr:LysR family transcriptional regulator [Nocardioides sp. LHD-245]
MFNLDQLRGFVAVAEELHFGRAAARLSMTQPPLSRSVQRLESELGVRLFDRDSRGVALTPAGAVFVEEARALLRDASGARDLVRRVASGEGGTLRIGFTAGSASVALPDLLEQLAHRVPGVEVELVEMVTGEQIDALSRQETDLGLARPPFRPAGLRSREWHREALVAAVPAEHPLALSEQPLRPADLIGHPIILHEPDRAAYFHRLVTTLVPIRDEDVRHTVSQILTMICLVAAGRGIALVPSSAASLRMEGVSYRPLATRPERPVELHLAWSPHSLNPALPVALRGLTPLTPSPSDARSRPHRAPR